MPVPILRQGDCLIAPIQEALTDQQMTDLRSRLADQVSAHRARAVVIDVSGLDLIDSYTARTIQDTTRMLKLKGAVVTVVGIQPTVAFAMVQLGLRLDGVMTALDLDGGLALVRESWRVGDGAVG